MKDLSWPLEIYLERDDFQNVFKSLLDRSIHSLGGGPGIVRVILQASVRSVTVTVEDNGRGFEPENIKGGLGLVGLRERTQLLNGDLMINSQINKGTKIEVTIPIQNSRKL